MILITGGTGFLGRYIVRKFLDCGKDLRLLVRNTTHPALKEFEGRVELAEGDVMDVASLQRAFEGVSGVIHCATLVTFRRSRRPEMRAVAETGTANIVNACLEYGISEKLVHISSVAAYGCHEGELDEGYKYSDKGTRTYYSDTKYWAEKQIHRGVQEGLRAVICQPSLIIGAGDWSSGTPSFFKRIDKGLLIYTTGNNGMVGADDVAEAVRILYESDLVNGEKFIISSENIMFKHLFEMIAKYLKVKPPRIPMPKSPAIACGAIIEAFCGIFNIEPLITRETTRSSSLVRNCNGSLFARTFGFTYEPIESVVKRTAKQFLNEHENKSKR